MSKLEQRWQVPAIEAPSAAILRGSDGPTLSSSMEFPSSLSLFSAPWAWPICSKAGMQSLLSLSYSSQILMLHEIHCWVFLGTLKGILTLCYPKEFRIVCTCMLQPILAAASSSSSSGGFRDCKNSSKLIGRLGSFCMDYCFCFTV
jgi:hypothetical protein